LRAQEALYFLRGRFKLGCTGGKIIVRQEGTRMRKIVSPIGVLALIWGLIGPIPGHAEIVSVPSAAPSSSDALLPPPTVLRGSPPSSTNLPPICPPGYTLSPGYGCIGPSAGDYAEGWPGYDYWPDYGYGYPGFGYGAGRFHRLARFRGFQGFHRPAGFHGAARLGGAGAGHVGGFARR
jgi:hypothetical protein